MKMKTSLPKTGFVFIAFICLNLLLSTGCKQEPCDDAPIIDTLEILSPQIYKEALNSYSGNDTLKFISENSEIYTFIGQGLYKGYYRSFEFMEDRCNTQYTHYNAFEGYNFLALDYTSDIEFYVRRAGRNDLFFHTVIDKYDFYRYADLPPIGHSWYIQNLEINGEKYDNVLKIFQDYNNLEKSYIYYSMDEGIIQIVFSNGHTLTKI